MAVIHMALRENIPERVENPDILTLHALWEEQQRGEVPPDPVGFKIEHLDWCSDNLMFLKALPGGDFLYEHYGSAIAEAAGFDMTGMKTSDFDSEVGNFFRSKYTECLESGRPIYTKHRADQAATVRTWERIMLPLADSSGQRFVLAYNRPAEYKHELLEKILDSSRDGIVVLEPEMDGSGNVTDFTIQLANKEMCSFLKKTEHELLSTRLSKSFPDNLAQPLIEICGNAIGNRKGDVFDISFGVLEEKTHYRVNAACVSTGVALTISDMTELKRQEAQLIRLAAIDPLTSAMNRRAFFQIGEYEIKRSRRHGHDLSLLMLDIDHFKAVNDTYGHDAGDEVLIALSELCSDVLRSTDRFSRLGGEEFAVLLPETDTEGAFEIGERLRQRVASEMIETTAGPLSITTSIGIAAVICDGDHAIDRAMKAADDALYRAKNLGRNRVEV